MVTIFCILSACIFMIMGAIWSTNHELNLLIKVVFIAMAVLGIVVSVLQLQG